VAIAVAILRSISDWLDNTSAAHRAGLDQASTIKPEESAQAWAVIESVYAAQLSDRALNWLTENAVITTEQRTNPAAILRCISDWLERAAAQDDPAPRRAKGWSAPSRSCRYGARPSLRAAIARRTDQPCPLIEPDRQIIALRFIDVETAKQTGRVAFGEMVTYLNTRGGLATPS
jgi:hypothetical protein